MDSVLVYKVQVSEACNFVVFQSQRHQAVVRMTLRACADARMMRLGARYFVLPRSCLRDLVSLREGGRPTRLLEIVMRGCHWLVIVV